ncbi:hypothetical protein T265_07234 [Opisthorchis viverrini]|uniref:Uncharacterized protein n=1 Tax=Opisthorchis viverrini TaxID=6198 RepID=A0A075AC69_OPIVI|nr:hypothetical protein T265_07234 [Opisthorchis viverrini]KER25299.1 hypothetical protein T265_07234 [Opisthorchis viverrini]
MPPEGSTRAGILPGCPSLDRSRVAEVGFEPRSVNSRSTHLGHLAPNKRIKTFRSIRKWLKWLEREFTDRKVRGSNPTSATRLLLSRLGRHGSIPALVPPSCGMAARHRKGATTERLLFYYSFAQATVLKKRSKCRGRVQTTNLPVSKFAPQPVSHLKPPKAYPRFQYPPDWPLRGHTSFTMFVNSKYCARNAAGIDQPPFLFGSDDARYRVISQYETDSKTAQWLEREFACRKVRGSNLTSASRLGQPGSISAFVLPSGGMAARYHFMNELECLMTERESTSDCQFNSCSDGYSSELTVYLRNNQFYVCYNNDNNQQTLWNDVCAPQRMITISTRKNIELGLKKSFRCSTFSVRNCHATRRLHMDWDTARLPKPRQEKSSSNRGPSELELKYTQLLKMLSDEEASIRTRRSVVRNQPRQLRLLKIRRQPTTGFAFFGARIMKEITKRLGAVGATRLPGWGPRDPHCAWLETLQDMAANLCQWRFCCQILSRLPELSNKLRLYGSEASMLNTDVMLSMMMMMMTYKVTDNSSTAYYRFRPFSGALDRCSPQFPSTSCSNNLRAIEEKHPLLTTPASARDSTEVTVQSYVKT